MTLKDLKSSRLLWLGRRTRARAHHRRYVFLSRHSREGSARHKRLMARRGFWSRAADKAARMVATRDRAIRVREPQQVSKAGLEMLVREEGVRRYAYNDPAGHATFGVGHLIHHGGVTSADLAKWGSPKNPKPMAVVFDVLKRDLDAFEAAVRDAVKVKMSVNEFDALVSLAFNIGIGGFRGSTVVRRLNAGDRRGAADAFRMWANPSMLKARRERERSLFLK